MVRKLDRIEPGQHLEFRLTFLFAVLQICPAKLWKKHDFGVFVGGCLVYDLERDG